MSINIFTHFYNTKYSYTNNIYTILYGIKYSYLTVYTQLYCIKNYSCLIIIFGYHTIECLQVFLSNSKYPQAIIRLKGNKNKNYNSNKCMDILSDKLAKIHTRRLGLGYERVRLREKLNLFLWLNKTTLFRPIILKPELIRGNKTVLCVVRYETINHIKSEWSKLGQKVYKTSHDWLGRLSTGNCAKNFNFAVLPNGIYSNLNQFWRTKHIKFSRILRYKRINNSQTEDQNLW